MSSDRRVSFCITALVLYWWTTAAAGLAQEMPRTEKPKETKNSPAAGISGAAVWDSCRIQVDELCAWRKAGAWSKAILAVGGITTVERARESLAIGANAAMVATAALVDPLIAARFRTTRV